MSDIRLGVAFAICIGVGMVWGATAWSNANVREWEAERARPTIHNNAAKCGRHCHNAGLRVMSWDGAYPADRTQHGCRCGE